MRARLALKAHYRDQIDSLRRQRNVLKNRLALPEAVLHENENHFYSSWLYSAAHALASIPENQTVGVLTARLQLPVARCSEILEFLCRLGLLEPAGARYKPGRRSVYLSSESPNIARHHINWRVRAIQAVQRWKFNPGKVNGKPAVMVAYVEVNFRLL